MNKKLSFICFVLFVPLLLGAYRGTAQLQELPISKIDSLMQVDSKPILLLLSTDWCQYCKVQKKQLEKNGLFVSGTGEFYFVEFDAESTAPVIFNKNTFINKKSKKRTGVYHELALRLLGAPTQAFPVWIILDKEYQEVFRYDGVLKPAQINAVIQSLEQLK